MWFVFIVEVIGVSWMMKNFQCQNVGRNTSHTKNSTAFGDWHIWFQLLQTAHHFQIWRFCSFLSNSLQFNFTGLALIFLFAQSNFAPGNLCFIIVCNYFHNLTNSSLIQTQFCLKLVLFGLVMVNETLGKY